MNFIRDNKKILWIAMAVFVLASFCLALFHTHEHGESHQDCPVCRVIASFVALLTFSLFVLAALLRTGSAVPVLFKDGIFSLFAFERQGRSPPSLA